MYIMGKLCQESSKRSVDINVIKSNSHTWSIFSEFKLELLQPNSKDFFQFYFSNFKSKMVLHHRSKPLRRLICILYPLNSWVIWECSLECGMWRVKQQFNFTFSCTVQSWYTLNLMWFTSGYNFWRCTSFCL